MSAIYPPMLSRVTLTATLAAWLRSRRAGFVESGDVVSRTEAAVEDLRDHEHLVIDDSEPESNGVSHATPLALAVPELANVPATELRLVLPSAGDTRGLPVLRATSPTPLKRFMIAAMDAGAAILYPDSAAGGTVGLVVEPIHGRMVAWHRYVIPPATPDLTSPAGPTPRDELTVAEADGVLLTALRDITALLDRLDLARQQPEQAARLAAFRALRTVGPDLPMGYPQRNRLLVARAAMVLGITELAAGDSEGGAVNSHEIGARMTALRDVAAAARRACSTAINGPLGADTLGTTAVTLPHGNGTTSLKTAGEAWEPDGGEHESR